MNTLAGKWIANLEKSHRHANHQFQSASLSIDVSGNRVSLTHSGINMSGKYESGTTVLHADGQAYAVSTEAPDVVVIARTLDCRTLQRGGLRTPLRRLLA